MPGYGSNKPLITISDHGWSGGQARGDYATFSSESELKWSERLIPTVYVAPFDAAITSFIYVFQ